MKENRAILDNMSRVLVEKETIYTEEVALLMKGASYKEVIEYMEKDGDEHEKNPFIRMTAPSAEHIVSDNAEEKETFKVVESVEIKGDVDEMDVEIAEIVDEPNAANETEEAENKDEE